MEKFNFGVAKILQFVVIVFFAFVLSFYFGSLLLIPLGILVAIVDILSAIGFNGIFATIVGVPAVGWLCYKVYQIENLFPTLLQTGIKMYELGIAQNKLFEGVAETVKPAASSADDDSIDAGKSDSDVKPA